MRKQILFFAVTGSILALSACGPGKDSTDTISEESRAESSLAETVEAADTIEEIKGEEHIGLEEAWEMVEGKTFEDPEDQAFVTTLEDLKNCSGAFVQVSEETGNRYAAQVSFYLDSGRIYCSVDYSGYMGEIQDGEVSETEEEGYLFCSEPKGDLYGKEQDFEIFFGTDRLHIMWGSNIDYVLTRGDGAVDQAQDYKPPFDETEIYKNIVSMIENNFANINHKVVFDRDDSALNVFIEAPATARNAMDMKNAEVMEAWDSMVESMKSMGDPLWEIVRLVNGAESANVYIVAELKSDDEYEQDEYLLWIRNGEVNYNYMEDKTEGKGGVSWEYAPDTTGSATTGEKNALNKAYDYLDYTAFSRSGLIDQLEFEGYSTSEATYAVDHCGADWNEQAVKKAQQYLDYMSFSKSGLIDQLEFEGFTPAQAEYGANAVY